jgi:hypothetical protein
MMDTERGGFEEQPRHQFNSTQIFAGPNDGLSQTHNGVSVDDEFDLDIRLYAPGIEGGGIQAMAEDPEKVKHHTQGEHATCHTCATLCPELCKATQGDQNTCCRNNTCL